ncbi:MAG: hypothetical protein LR015_01610 [Verrucomicrobia bacterium]|nr:hypothetical protein [Verrucomicrobiota bacterium]
MPPDNGPRKVRLISSLGSRFALIWLLCLSFVAKPGIDASENTVGQSYELTNELLRVTIVVGGTEEEAEFGPRFDRSGVVRSIQINSHELLGPWGLADEFGIYGEGVLGYENSGTGDVFTKIGFGELQRVDDSDYHFATRFPVVRRFEHTVESSSRKLTILQSSGSHTPWPYEYQKTYSLGDTNTLRIEYQLTNMGLSAWSFEHYNHHWFRPEGTLPGPDYELTTEFPLPMGWEPFAISNNSLRLKAELGADDAAYMAGPLNELTSAQADFRIKVFGRNLVHYRADFKPYRFALFIDYRGFCPELFFRADLAPGESVSWSATYQFGDTRNN